MELSDILRSSEVLAIEHVADKDELLAIASRHAATAFGLDPDAVLSGIKEREALGSTGLGGGIAIPHSKFHDLSQVRGVFVRLARPVEFGAVDDVGVDLMMMLLAPFGAGAEHLRALACVARLLRYDDLVVRLRSAPDVCRIHSLLTQGPHLDKAGRAA